MTDQPSSLGRAARIVIAIARVLLGLPLLVGGANGLFHFFPDPDVKLPEGATAFVTALAQSGYMLQLIAVTHLVVGLLLVSGFFVPLALALLAPFLVNALCFHLFLERSGLPVVIVFCAFELGLAWAYRGAFKPMLSPRARPGG